MTNTDGGDDKRKKFIDARIKLKDCWEGRSIFSDGQLGDRQMKAIFKVLFLLVSLSTAVPVLAQSDYEATKARAYTGDANTNAQAKLGVMYADASGNCDLLI